ncbi:MAG: Rieske 2Fe-2S domain-containing protein [Steroidobacteraceae bacterium]
MNTHDNFDNFLRVSADHSRSVRRDLYTDPEIFELEMQSIWERVWVYVGHESQLPKHGDFLSTKVGRQPVLVVRNKAGEVRAFINACRHRGATLCRTAKGNARMFVCPYHSWTFNADGELVGVKDQSVGGYPKNFDKKLLGLTSVPRLESYRGFIFACLNPDIESLTDYLGSAAAILDLLVDQSGQGLEILKGHSSYTYDGNWKMQAENGVDGYHASTVHGNFLDTIRHRLESAKTKEGAIKAMDIVANSSKIKGGGYDLGNGHSLIWGEWTNAQDRFNVGQRAEVTTRVGEIRATWIFERMRNLLIYPSVLIMDAPSTQVRMIRPLSVNKTEVQIFCIAPVGEPAEDRRNRIRYYEDFYNASGMATPDDLSEFAASQNGFMGAHSPWSDISRGTAHEVAGADEHARALDLKPVKSGVWVDDEVVYEGQYRQWIKLMNAGARG